MLGSVVLLGWDVAVAAVTVAVLATGMAVRLWTVTLRSRRIVGELNASRDQYRALASNLPEVSVLLFDHDLRFTLVEGGALEAHGWHRDEIIGSRPNEVLPRAFAARLMPHFANALRGIESSASTPGARGGHFMTEFVPVHDHAGRVAFGMAVLRDVSEQRANERRRELLGAVVGELSDGLTICDEQGRVLRFDPESRRAAPRGGAGRPARLGAGAGPADAPTAAAS